MATVSHKTYIQRLYRQSLRTAFDHYAFDWGVYRQHCLKIRARFDANKSETNPVRIKALVKETEEELAREAHSRPFKCNLNLDRISLSFTYFKLILCRSYCSRWCEV